MYYPESDIIAARWPKWQRAIEQLDDLFASNAGKLLTRDFVCRFVDESVRTVDILLNEYVKLGVVKDVEAVACPSHPEVVQATKDDEGDFYCDLCDEKYDANAVLRCTAILCRPAVQSSIYLKSPCPVGTTQSAGGLSSGVVPQDYRFDVAISFAGDSKRDRIRQVVRELGGRFGDGRIFFDEDFEHEIAGVDADTFFQNVFGKRTLLVVTCVCKRYNEKPWTRSEWRAIRSFITEHWQSGLGRFRFLPIRFDDGEIDGLFSNLDVIPDVRHRTPIEIADLISKRYEVCCSGDEDAASSS